MVIDEGNGEANVLRRVQVRELREEERSEFEWVALMVLGSAALHLNRASAGWGGPRGNWPNAAIS